MKKNLLKIIIALAFLSSANLAFAQVYVGLGLTNLTENLEVNNNSDATSNLTFKLKAGFFVNPSTRIYFQYLPLTKLKINRASFKSQSTILGSDYLFDLNDGNFLFAGGGINMNSTTSSDTAAKYDNLSTFITAGLIKRNIRQNLDLEISWNKSMFYTPSTTVTQNGQKINTTYTFNSLNVEASYRF